MLFNSVLFLYAFLPVTYLVYRLLKNKTHRFVWLTITGYIFYGAWDWRFCFLMAFSTLVSYSAGLGFLKWDKNPKYRRLCLVVPVVIDLLLLGFLNILISSWNQQLKYWACLRHRSPFLTWRLFFLSEFLFIPSTPFLILSTLTDG